jgi:tRNA(fMet)-specific endonuclease VapC
MMFVLDTDTLSLLMHGHARMTERTRTAEAEVVITVISRIEILQGRFASVLTAEDGEKLLRAQERLDRTDIYLRGVRVLPVEGMASAEFDKLRANRKLKKIGRADLLIAAIALAHRATVVTRNLRHFRQVPNLRVENWAD